MTASTKQPAPVEYLSRVDICRRWRISRATSYQMQKKGFLSPPLKLSEGVARWPVSEIEAMEARATAERGTARPSRRRGGG